MTSPFQIPARRGPLHVPRDPTGPFGSQLEARTQRSLDDFQRFLETSPAEVRDALLAELVADPVLAIGELPQLGVPGAPNPFAGTAIERMAERGAETREVNPVLGAAAFGAGVFAPGPGEMRGVLRAADDLGRRSAGVVRPPFKTARASRDLSEKLGVSDADLARFRAEKIQTVQRYLPAETISQLDRGDVVQLGMHLSRLERRADRMARLRAAGRVPPGNIDRFASDIDFTEAVAKRMGVADQIDFTPFRRSLVVSTESLE